MGRANVLIVDDEKNILTTLSRALRVEGFDVDVAGTAAIAFERLAARSYDVCILDVNLPDLDGIRVLERMRAEKNETPVLVMSGHGTIDTALSATRLGAHDFLEKPIATERLVLSIERTLDFHRLKGENSVLKRRSGVFDDLIGASTAMNALRERVERAANAKAAVLVHGERGTGKELVARAIHLASKRAAGPLEKLNCAAVPADLIESELFGHEAGAFTGATKQRRGKFERASGGTIFLDEVGDMPAAMQAKLLRVLQEGEIERVGGNELIKIDARVVAASNRLLSEEVERGTFRADLYDRLNVIPISIPPLRERKDDVELLATHFLKVACEANEQRLKTLLTEAMGVLVRYPFPGNVRELRNVIERLVVLTAHDELTAADVQGALPGAAKSTGSFYQPGRPLRDMLDDVERDLLTRAIEHNDGHMTRTAEELGLERSHLYKKVRALGLTVRSE